MQDWAAKANTTCSVMVRPVRMSLQLPEAKKRCNCTTEESIHTCAPQQYTETHKLNWNRRQRSACRGQPTSTITSMHM